MKLSDNAHVTLSIDDSVPCLEWIGKGRMPSKVFRASEEESLRFYIQYKALYPRLEWFVDATRIAAVSPQDTQWVVDEILPGFAAAGLRKEAFVVAASAVGLLVVKNYESQAGKRIEIKVFDSAQAAKAWLTT